MMVKKEIPDKIIELSQGDIVQIFVRKNKLTFWFSCDGSGNVFELSKDEIKRLMSLK